MKYGGKMLHAEKSINNRSDRGVPRAIDSSTHPPEGSDIYVSGIKKNIDMKRMQKKKLVIYSPKRIDQKKTLVIYSPKRIDMAYTVKPEITRFPHTLRNDVDAISGLYSVKMIARMDSGIVVPLHEMKLLGHNDSFSYQFHSEMEISVYSTSLPSSRGGVAFKQGIHRPLFSQLSDSQFS